MIQACQWIPMHADLARSMFLRFPVQSCSMCGFRTFHAKPQVACFPGFLCKAADRVLPGFSCKAAGRVFPGFSYKAAGRVLPDFSCKATVRVLPGFCFPCECGFRQVRLPVESSFPCECCFRASAPVPEPYRHELSFCASTCAFIR